MYASTPAQGVAYLLNSVEIFKIWKKEKKEEEKKKTRLESG